MRDFEKIGKCPHCGRPFERAVYITIRQVADMTGMHYNTIYRHKEELGGVKRCGQWRFAVAKVESFMKN